MVEQQFKIGYIAREQVAASKWWYSVQSTYNQEKEVNDLYTRVMIKGAFDDKKNFKNVTHPVDRLLLENSIAQSILTQDSFVF